MDRNELREACINAVINSGDPTSTADPTWSEVIDAVIRTVLEAVAAELDRRVEYYEGAAENSDPGWSSMTVVDLHSHAAEAIADVADGIRSLLLSTDSEAIE